MISRRQLLTAASASALALALPGKASAFAPWPTGAWSTATPVSQGLDPVAVTDLNTYASANSSHALLVVRNGYLVHEAYYAGKNAATLFDGYSIAKSVTSMTVGAAIAAGDIPSANSLASLWYPALASDPLKSQIKISHLLNMTSGINFSNSADYAAMIASPDWASFVLSKGMQNTPGLRWRYKADPNVLSGIIKKATGHDLWWQTQASAFNAMGITSNVAWTRDSIGNANGSGDLKMTAQHFARFGYLYLRNGEWDGQQLIPSAWVAESHAPTNYPDRAFCNCWTESGFYVSSTLPPEHHYGWWSRKWAGTPEDAYYAFGGVGQFVIVVPSMDLVVVRMGNGPNPYPDGVFLRDMLLKIANLEA